MYDSGIAARTLISNVSSEADITIPIDSESWYRWINAVEQFVYTEILNEYTSVTLNYAELTNNTINLNNDITTANGCAAPNFDDIIKIYADETELDRTSVISGLIFVDKPLYYTDYSGNIKMNLTGYPKNIVIVYRLRPELKSSLTDRNINIPIEFIDMLAARMRGEAYKIANEDNLSAKWLSDYNIQLESFKLWATRRNERYGE